MQNQSTPASGARPAATAENPTPTTRNAEIAADGAPTSPEGGFTHRDVVKAGAASVATACGALAVSQASAEEHEDAVLIGLWRE